MAAVSDRRGDTRTTITAAAAELLRQHGPAAITTRRVADTAGVQAPTIYRLFGDKAGLLDAVAEYVMATYVASKAAVVQEAAARDLDPVDELRAGWATQIDFGVANPTLFGFLNDPARGLRSPAVESGLRILAARVHRVALVGRLRVTEQRAVDLIRAAGAGTVTTILSTPPERRDPELAEAMLEAVLRHVITDAPHPADTDADASAADPTTAAVTLRAIAPQLDLLSQAERRLLAEWLDRVIGSPVETPVRSEE